MLVPCVHDAAMSGWPAPGLGMRGWARVEVDAGRTSHCALVAASGCTSREAAHLLVPWELARACMHVRGTSYRGVHVQCDRWGRRMVLVMAAAHVSGTQGGAGVCKPRPTWPNFVRRSAKAGCLHFMRGCRLCRLPAAAPPAWRAGARCFCLFVGMTNKPEAPGLVPAFLWG